MPAAGNNRKRLHLNPVTCRRAVLLSLPVALFLFIVLPAAAFTFTPSSPQAGDAITFTYTGPTGYSFVWSFGDGSIGSGNPITHTYKSPGSYTVRLRYMDGIDPLPVSEIRNISISPATGRILVVVTFIVPATTTPAPSAVRVAGVTIPTTTPTSSTAGRAPANVTAAFTFDPALPKVTDPVNFSAVATTDPAGLVNLWRWDFGDGSTGSGETVVHRYTEGGVYLVNLTVYRSADPKYQRPEIAYGSVTQTVSVRSSRLPYAVFTIFPTQPDIMDLVSFDASNASDPDGFIRTYTWDFGDNTTGTGPKVTHAFPDLGERDIVLTVTDDDGNTDSATVRITILPVIRPSVNISAVPAIPREEAPVFFTAEDLVDPKGLIDQYTWQFGDRATASGPRTTHAFAREGSYTVTLVVSSSTFAELRTAAFYTGTASRSITVQPLDLPVPVLVVSPEKPAEKESVLFDASASHSAGGEIVSYRWDFGDGTGGDGARVFHAYPAPGTYPVVLTITDSRGRTGTVQKDLPVAAGYIFFLWPILAVSLIAAGYLGVRKFRQGIARKRRPRIPTTIGWNGRIATKGETGAGPHRVVVRFIGGVEDRNKKR